MNTPEPISQAGGVVFRLHEGALEILLVQVPAKPGAWTFPQDRVRKDETDMAAALRAVRDQAGVEGRIVAALDPPMPSPAGAERAAVRYFLIEAPDGQDGAREGKGCWLPPMLAAKAAAQQDTRARLTRAMPHLDVHVAERRGEYGQFRELLLHEFDHAAESLLQNEQDGERRVTFFLALAAGIGAVLGFVMSSGAPYDRRVINAPLVLTLVALLAIGYLTFVRVITRKLASDRYKQKLNRLRRWFLPSSSDPRRRWLPYDPYDERKRTPWSAWPVRTGGWLETIALVNAMIVGALLAALVPTPNGAVECVVAVVGAVAAWVGLIVHANGRYRRELRNQRRYAGLRPDQARRMRRLEQENARLRKEVAEMMFCRSVLDGD